MLRLRKVSEIYDMKVFTDEGDYFGDIEEVMISKNKISGWRVRSTKNSYLSKALGTARGVIVPHALVKSIGDVMIINNSAIPAQPQESDMSAA